eukprot:CAMPEP_0170476926 /NCGR_PEP_ID=MMETSP0123-20130129/18274_1 /TAXON_ID=182087 /ORGANISM="Favella ehrenbergii, Strain Fehren 1" /LENGTH=36 /DNA_ID= /DNA_START= /DNA_END= /DNA_ORIENTATION=
MSRRCTVSHRLSLGERMRRLASAPTQAEDAAEDEAA